MVTSAEIREKYLKFFESKGHTIIPSSPLVPEDSEQLAGKEKVLFTSAGMQPLVPYLFGELHPTGSKRLVDSQKCLRTDDIDEVGDTTHHTFFEMLGNWSLGDYWKKEAIEFSFEFLIKELEIPVEKLAVSVFAGDADAPRDEESAKAWLGLGIPENKVFYFNKQQNWWPTPRPNSKGQLILPTGPCGPDTEMFYWTGTGEPEGTPDTDSRWVEIWNDVFMEFNNTESGLEPLKQKNVDTGMGLDRTTAVLQGVDDDYLTDLFSPIIKKIEEVTSKKYEDNKKEMRIVADHARASVFLILAGVIPANKLQGYILRRLLRRAAVKMNRLNGDINSLSRIAESVLEIYDGLYEINKQENEESVKSVINEETERFSKTLDRGLKEVQKIEQVDGKIAFDLYQSYGFPLELTEELFREKGQEIDRAQFAAEFEKHKEASRSASVGTFKGGLAGDTPTQRKYHTTAHLLQASLKRVLGDHIKQAGQNITDERLRFDFTHSKAITKEEIERISELVNQKIAENLPVTVKIMKKEDALKDGAVGLFTEKYGDEVSIYTIGNPSASSGPPFSREFCGGPHVAHTGEIGHVTITKEESASSGVRRVYVELVNSNK